MKLENKIAAIACGAAALIAGGTATASAAPITPATTMSTTFQNPFTGSTGDPFPVGTLTVVAETGHTPGVTRLLTTSNCPSLAPPGAGTCANYSLPVDVHWVNINTGASGTARIPSGSFGTAEPAVDVETGSGRIAATVTGATILTLVPGLGTFEAT